jgi:hypothetical protein|tara:strand:+ start:9378 stop:10292 length:915 start_codon:yes stop_codon:yes gene_type:complete
MSTENEVKEVQQPEVDEIEVEVTENEASSEASSEDELEKYTKSVSKRINKLNARNRATEERAAKLEAALQQREAEVQNYYQHAIQAQSTILQKEEEAVESKEREANELYKKAVSSGDADLMSKADSLKTEVSIQKEKIRIAKQKQDQDQNSNYTEYQEPAQQQYQQPEPQPTQEALDWQKQNQWYGTEAEPTQYAYFTHVNLVQEGYEPDSDDYYNELNNRIYKVYPDLRSDNAGQSEGRPAVQRVASASVGSRQKTQGKKNGVSFTKSEVETLRGIKPHGMSDDVWLKSVAREKQKIANREAK